MSSWAWLTKASSGVTRRLAGAGGAGARWAASPRARGVSGGAAVVVLAAALLNAGLVRVREGEVGVLVNNVSGQMRIEQRAGFRLTVPWVYSFYRLDRRVQALAMTDRPGAGFGGGDAVKIKTRDGSNVSLDIQVNYRLLPERAADLLQSAGPGPAFGQLWIRSAVRAAAAAELGKLTTEEVYNATLRNERALALASGLNAQLGLHGIEIVAVVPQELRFYKEYEEIIRAKKLADQEVEEQQAQARLASEERTKQVANAQFEANARVGTAQGEADRIRAEAEGYLQRTRLEAEGALVRAEGRAEGLLAGGLAEAQGLKESALSLSGAGGVNLVALEYALKLGRISFTGVPVVQEGRVGQLRVHSGGAVAGCVGAECAGAK